MLELKHIVKKYDEKVILDDISLTVEDGEIISILGPSGGGKTTLLNVILELRRSVAVNSCITAKI